MKKLSNLMIGLSMLAATSLGFAADADYAGVVKTVRGSATVERGSSKVALAPGSRVNPGDRLVTGTDGYVGVTMRDDTLLTVGPNAALSLDEYAFDPKTHDGNFLVSLGKGMLSVVTGLIAKRSPDSFVVRTRVSTMGVRGTEFIVEANDDE